MQIDKTTKRQSRMLSLLECKMKRAAVALWPLLYRRRHRRRLRGLLGDRSRTQQPDRNKIWWIITRNKERTVYYPSVFHENPATSSFLTEDRRFLIPVVVIDCIALLW